MYIFELHERTQLLKYNSFTAIPIFASYRRILRIGPTSVLRIYTYLIVKDSEIFIDEDSKYVSFK